MKPIHYILLGAAALFVWYVSRSGGLSQSPDSITRNQSGGTQTIQPRDQAAGIMGLVTAAFQLGTTALQSFGAKPSATAPGTTAQTSPASV